MIREYALENTRGTCNARTSYNNFLALIDYKALFTSPCTFLKKSSVTIPLMVISTISSSIDVEI